MLISDELYQEYVEVLARPVFAERFGLTSEEVAEFFLIVAGKAQKVTPLASLPVEVRDVKDEEVLEAALGGHADYLVTSDEDLLVLRGDPRLGSLQIATVGEFLRVSEKRLDDR